MKLESVKLVNLFYFICYPDPPQMLSYPCIVSDNHDVQARAGYIQKETGGPADCQWKIQAPHGGVSSLIELT